MLLLTSTSDKVQIITTTTANVDVHASFIDLAAGVVTAGRLNTKITTATTTDVVASPAASTTRNVKTLTVANVHASASNQVTIQHTDGANVVQMEQVTLLAGERIAYREGIGMRVIDAAGMEKVNTPINVGQYSIGRLAADVANTTTTAAKITGLDQVVGPGTWVFEYFVLYQTAATTTGIGFGCNHTGTVTSFVYDGSYVDTSATASTGAPDQDALATTAQVMGAYAARAKSTTAPFLTASVDTLSADMLFLITGLAVVTVSGNLELYSKSEVAASAATVKAGSVLRLTRAG